jgi:hypothetical protein
LQATSIRDEYPILNIECPIKKLKLTWILGVGYSLLGAGCLLLDIAANTNSQYRITNAEYPAKRVLNNWWILDIGCSLLDIAANTNNQYRIANAEYLEKRVLNNWWILDIGCSVLVIEANMNSQF